MRRLLVLVAIPVTAVALALAARADDPPTPTSVHWTEYGDGAAALPNEKVPGVLFFHGNAGAAAEFRDEAIQKVFSHPNFCKKSAKLVCMKVATDQDTPLLKQFGVAQGASAIAIVDFEEALVEKIAERPSLGGVTKALEKAEEQCKRKKKAYEAIESAMKKADKANATKNYATSAPIYEWVVAQEAQVKSPLIAQAKERIQGIKAEADAEIAKVDNLITNKDWGKAQNECRRIKAQYPLKEVAEAVKTREETIARELSRYKK